MDACSHLDDREARAIRVRKSIGAENTFSSHLFDFKAMPPSCPADRKVWRHCDDKGARGQTVTVKISSTISSSSRGAGRDPSRSRPQRTQTVIDRLAVGRMRAPRLARRLGVSLSSPQGRPQMDPPIGFGSEIASVSVNAEAKRRVTRQPAASGTILSSPYLRINSIRERGSPSTYIPR
ncbi:hypothetical protein FXV83_05330 [Bradyrhizobium hipponense]|uniref:DNA polymerase Y-family little finger domain-containing protein n=1 Tax=Bradyrhizobium hipponense TaxID=2605638 RepID=A0A5S4YUP8_9BRAD|nr:hypothetical protein FXV83_05330 [Bradyrhizobium hipponense]